MIIMLKGKKYDEEKFMEKYGIPSKEKALEYMNKCVRNGEATIYNPKSDEKRLIDKLDNDIEFENVMDAIRAEEENAKKYARAKKAEDVDLVSIKLNFSSTSEAVMNEEAINRMGIEDTEISISKGVISLIVRNITPQEYTKIASKYKMDKAISNTVKVADKTVSTATDAVNYVATKVVAPGAKIAGAGIMNLGKGLLQTTIKTGAGVVNATAEAKRETAKVLATDTEMLKAKEELKEAKNSALRFFKSKFGVGKSGNGIEML